LISDTTKKEYKKHEIVHGVAIDSNDGSILVQILINESDADSVKICEEVKQKLSKEFDSVKDILKEYGIEVKHINFLVV
jgi:ribosome maturation factor RimP